MRTDPRPKSPERVAVGASHTFSCHQSLCSSARARCSPPKPRCTYRLDYTPSIMSCSLSKHTPRPAQPSSAAFAPDGPLPRPSGTALQAHQDALAQAALPHDYVGLLRDIKWCALYVPNTVGSSRFKCTGQSGELHLCLPRLRRHSQPRFESQLNCAASALHG